MIKLPASQAPNKPSKNYRWDQWALVIALLAGLLHGLVYVYLIPPWQHYDEPSHFEYAWLIAHRWRLPQPGDYDQEMRRATAESMIQHGFFKGLKDLPDLESSDKPIWIGDYSQLSDPPFYYLVGSIPLIAFTLPDITTQLYAVRLVSLLFYLVTIFCAWGLARELTPPGHPLRLLVPLTLALLPGFTDVMTAVNDIVGGVAVFSLCLWGCIQLVDRGFSLPGVLWAGLTALLCLFINPAVYIAPAIFLLALLFALFRGTRRWIAWGTLAIFTVVGLIATVALGDPAHWYRSTTQALPLRQVAPGTVLGKYIFQVEMPGGASPDWSVPVFQQLGNHLNPGQYTLGVWMWASMPVEAQLPAFGNGSEIFKSRVRLGTSPAFYALPVTVVKNPARAWVSLDPETPRSQPVIVYYDGIVLAEGQRPLDQAPVYHDPDGAVGQWGGAQFTNVLQNASAERQGLRIRTWVNRLAGKYLPDNTLLSVVMAYLLDWKDASWHYRVVGATLFQTFWAKFGWGHVPLVGKYPYQALGVFSLLALIGVGVWLVRRILRRRQQPWGAFLPWEACFLLLLVLAVVWVAALARGVNYLPLLKMYIPVARYTYPAIIPAAMLIALGLWTLLRSVTGIFGSPFRLADRLALLAYLALFMALDIFSLISISSYYS